MSKSKIFFWGELFTVEGNLLIYFGDSKGNVWQLPYTMTKDTQKPKKGQ